MPYKQAEKLGVEYRKKITKLNTCKSYVFPKIWERFSSSIRKKSPESYTFYIQAFFIRLFYDKY